MLLEECIMAAQCRKVLRSRLCLPSYGGDYCFERAATIRLFKPNSNV